MKILYVHNDYAKPSGEEHAAGELVSLLREHGHEVQRYTRSSAEISDSMIGKLKALVSGIYNPFSAHKLSRILDVYNPDIVHVQNLYPLLSVSIFTPIKKRGIPVVMRCPNYRLFCPQGLSLDPTGHICERCWGGHEINCVKLNCMGSWSKSIGYALRNAYGRLSHRIDKGVNLFIVQSEFQKQKFIKQGIESKRIGILPGISPLIQICKPYEIGRYVSFVGRVSAEKGIYEFIEAAQANPDISFKVAGNLDENFHMPESLPANIEFVGFKIGMALDEFYAESRIIIVPSKWYEGFPNVIVRGMLHKKPIITSNVGAMQSIVEDNITGKLVEPGNSKDLSNAIKYLYNDIDACKRYGNNGYLKAINCYSRETIYELLIDIYNRAMQNSKLTNNNT